MQRFNFGNGVANTLQKDQNGRIVLAGNPKVGQTALNYDPNQKRREPEQVTQTHSGQMGEAIQPQSAVSQQVRQVLDQVLYNQTPEALTVAQNDIVEQISQTPEMDEWGRTVRQGEQHYEYDSQNRLTKISATDESGKLIPIADYRYNTFNQRIAKTTYNNQGSTTKTTYYFYDGNQLIAETTDEATQKAKNLKQYLWLNDTPIAVLDQDELYYIHTDHRNAPIAVTDSISKLVWQANNEDFGYASIHTKSSFELNLRLSNQYYDKESGLHYNTNRYYDALNQQYLTPDPLGLAAGPDLFAFALNQPHSISDPDGLEPVAHKRSEAFIGSAQEKFQVIISTAAKGKDKSGNYLLGESIRKELEMLVSGENLATTAGIFVAFSLIQATPVGWLADAAMLGAATYFLGTAAWDMLKAVVNIGKLLVSSCTYGELYDAAGQLRDAMAAAVAGGIGLTAAGSASKLTKLFKTLPDTLGLPKLNAEQTRKIKGLGLKPFVGAYKTLKQVINKPYTVKLANQNRGSTQLAFDSFSKNILGAKPKFINRTDNKSGFAVIEAGGKLNITYLAPNKGTSKPEWPSNMEPYLVEQLNRYKRTGFFENKKIPTDKRDLYDDLVKAVLGNCKGGIPAGRPAVILMVGSPYSSNCIIDRDKVSLSMTQVFVPAKSGELPIVKVFDADKKANGFTETKLKAPSRALLDFKKFKQCFTPYGSGYKKQTTDKGRKDYVDEYNRQLRRQQDALNSMTAAQYRAARDAYHANKGRHPKANYAQQSYRKDFKESMIIELRRQYRSEGLNYNEADAKANKTATNSMKHMAALHEPDMFAGGYNECTPSGMGCKSVNSSIGAQWKKVIGEMDEYADNANKNGWGDAKLNLQLDVCKK